MFLDITRNKLVLSLVPEGTWYGPGKSKGPGTGRGLVSLLITPIPENFKDITLKSKPSFHQV